MDILAVIFANEGVQRSLAGGAGGLARVLFLIITDKELPLKQSLALVGLGVLLGLFAAPWLQDIVGDALSRFRTDPDRLPTLTAFVTGGFSIAIIGVFIDFLKNRFLQSKKIEGQAEPDQKQVGDKP